MKIRGTCKMFQHQHAKAADCVDWEATPVRGTDCACMWQDGKVISFCSAHLMAADEYVNRRIKIQTDTLAEKYRKLCGVRDPLERL